MAVQVNPITQSLPATTAIQDPAVRRFAQAVDDALRALRSEEGAVESLKKAADAMNNAVAGGTPPSIAQWLFSSELYQKLTTEIARVDTQATQAKQDVLNEALARSQAIQEIQAALAEIESTPAYDPATTYQIGDLVTYDNKLYRAKAETTGNLPTNTTYWDKVGDYATIGDVVAAHTLQLSEIESDITDIGGDLAAEITARDTLATQLRGTYAGTDVAMVSQGLLYSERQARVTADGVTVSNLNALRAQVGVTEAGTLTEGFILNEQAIRNTNDLAIVSAVNTALAQITGVSTSISQSGENLIANWTTAQAQKWSQIESEVLTSGGQTIRAALLQESQTRANLEGDVYASYTLRVDANGNIAGFGLAADENSSEFIVRADKFAVVTDIGGTPHVPFAIGPSGAEFTGLTSWGNVQGKTGFAALDGKITPSNVTTYIDYAAIGNAQIGGNLWSTNWNYAGGSGWLLDRSGNFYGNNIYARGDIEASSLKANTAMVNRANIANAAVDTLQIAGNAVTIPVAASGTSSCQTPSVNFNSASLNIIVAGNSDLTSNSTHSTSGSVYLDLYRNGGLIRSWRVVYYHTTSGSRGGSVTAVFQDNPGAGAFYYTAVLRLDANSSFTASSQSVSVLVIGTRR